MEKIKVCIQNADAFFLHPQILDNDLQFEIKWLQKNEA